MMLKWKPRPKWMGGRECGTDGKVTVGELRRLLQNVPDEAELEFAFESASAVDLEHIKILDWVPKEREIRLILHVSLPTWDRLYPVFRGASEARIALSRAKHRGEVTAQLASEALSRLEAEETNDETR